MRNVVAGLWLAVGLGASSLLGGCGGGGGGGGGDSAPPPPPPTLSFAQASYAENVQFGQVGTGTVTAIVANASSITGTLYVQVAGADAVFSTDWSLAAIDATHYGITLHSLPSLATGHHTGQIAVTLCKDAACHTPYTATPAALPFDVDVEPSPLQATPVSSTASTVHWGASDGDVVQIQVSGDGLNWTAAAGASWLSLDSAAGSGAAALTVRYKTTAALDAGDYTDSVTIASNDGQSVKIPFTLHVLPAAFQLVGGVPSFNAVNGAPIASQDVAFDVDTGASSAWTLSSDASWMSVTASGNATPGTATLQPDPGIGSLASGSYTANLQLGDGTNTNVTGTSFASSLTLVTPTLSTSVPTITLGGSLGRDLSAQSLSLALNTGANAFPWTASGAPAWLSTTKSGVVNQAGTTLSAAPVAAAASAGSTSAVVTYSAAVNGDTVTAPVTVNLNLDQRRLLPSTWGIGLASSPTGTVLTRTITMRDNFGGNIAWTASSDSAWLSATAAGATGASQASLVLTADPSALPDGATSLAVVTVSSPVAGVAPAKIRVGLWKDPSGLASTTMIGGVSVKAMVADRVRPLVYVVDGSSTVSIYNAYTARLVGTVPNVGQYLTDLAASPDGSRLFVLDFLAASVKAINLDTLAVTDTWPVTGYLGHPSSLAAIRPNGVDVLLVNDGMYQGKAYVEGRFVGDVSPIGQVGILGRMTATDDGNHVYATPGYSPSLTMPTNVDYSAVSGGTILWSQAGPYSVDFKGALAVTGDGSALYASGNIGCEKLSPVDLSPIAQLPGAVVGASSIATTWDGRVACAFAAFSYMATGPDIILYSASGTTLGSYYNIANITGNGVGAVMFSPDGLLMIAASADHNLGFIPIGR
ncbi:YncE family protein [Scleromatobacter humisilvae]|uniref:BACON domain-containing protein n=1 Tax=Scleromatobacter humisilvae TaxID=2897159 RepID=A0A9X1YMY0_9BURK|nr:hypothetical protein [Scleromatobacter humisilvae]MCK9688425.1 hypothetical protein [Scleromatobacter humisilvae]